MSRILVVSDTPLPSGGYTGRTILQLFSKFGISQKFQFTSIFQSFMPEMKDHFNVERTRIATSITFQKQVESLQERIKQIDPNVIVTMGEASLFALTGKISPSKYRGSILPSLLNDSKVIPTIHPYLATKEYLFTYLIERDLRFAIDENNTKDLSLPERNYILAPSYAESMNFMEICKKSDVVAFDIEVFNEEMSCFSLAYDSKNIISIPFVKGGGKVLYFESQQETEIIRQLGLILDNPNILKLIQNATFDVTFVFHKYGLLTENIFDTMVAQALIYPEMPKGLDFITSMYTREPYYKDEGKHWKNPTSDTDRQFWLYNAKDSAVLQDSYLPLKDMLERKGLMETFEAQSKLIPILVYMGSKGIRVDQKGLSEQRDKATKELERLKVEIAKIMGDINIASPAQLKDYFYNQQGIKQYLSRSTGKPTTNEDALKRIARKGYPEASLILQSRTLSKMISTYYNTKFDDDGYMRCSYNPVGTKFGRLSSSKSIFGTGNNMQNQPPEMKKFYIADFGFVIYNLDLSQAENRIVAYVANEESMMRAFETGIDIHAQSGALISGLSIEEVKRQHLEGEVCHIGDGRHTWRYWGKKANHGFNYGWGYKGFALANEITETEGKMIREAYFAVYPGVKRYHNLVENKLKENNRTLSNLLGRRVTFLGRWGIETFKEAYSFIPQSSVADIINRRGLIPIYYDDLFKPVELLSQVHDSICFQIPLSIGIDKHVEIIYAIKKNLEQPLKWLDRTFVIPVDIEVGKSMKLEDDDKVKNEADLRIKLKRIIREERNASI